MKSDTLKATELLPVIQNCDGCGACCREQESPPGYLVLMVQGADLWQDDDDIRRFAELPAEARAILDEHLRRLRAGERRENLACVWFDVQTKRCKFYEHRPSICRETLQPGDEACRRWREEYRILPH